MQKPANGRPLTVVCLVTWGPFLESPGNLPGPICMFLIIGPGKLPALSRNGPLTLDWKRGWWWPYVDHAVLMLTGLPFTNEKH